MEFGIMFFSNSGSGSGSGRYDLLIEAAKLADQNGFSSVWTPERHFHPFGGIFPNPAITSAALAMVTENLQIRAGSLISPLHDALRIAEEWSMVDNLSKGRVAISFGSGWNVNDFIFFPERYDQRQAVMYEQIEQVRHLWGGGKATRDNSRGKPFEYQLYPQPIQAELPIWVTSSGNAETFESAGRIGANVLTHLIGQDLETLRGKIARYREAERESGHSGGKVSLMLHTFMGSDTAEVKAKVRDPFREYLRSAISLEQQAAIAGGVISGGHKIEAHELSENVMEELLDKTFERYFETAALMGTPESCPSYGWQLEEIGVDEVACLIDFGVDHESVLRSLQYVAQLVAGFSKTTIEQSSMQAVNAFVEDLEEWT